MASDTLKTTTDAYWGALGKLPALDAIFRACEQLEQEEESINRDNVKARSGITYTNLLATGIQLYRRRQDELAEFTHTPTSVLHVIAQAVDREFAALQAHYESQLSTWQADTETLQGDLIQELELLRLRNTRLESDLQEKNTQLEAQIEEQHALKSDMRALEKALNERDKLYHAALGEGENLRQALAIEKQSQLALTRDHQAELAAMKTEQLQLRQELINQHDKETARLQTQLGNERGEWKKEREELQTRLDQARLQQEHTQSELQAAKQALRDAQNRELEHQRQLSQRQEEAQQLAKQNQHAIAVLQDQLDQSAKTVVQLETELQLAKQTDPVQLATQLQIQALLEQLQRTDSQKR